MNLTKELLSKPGPLKRFIEKIFEEHTHQDEVIISIYAMIFPQWNDIEQLHGHPVCGEKLWRYIYELFIKFDKIHHPSPSMYGRWGLDQLWIFRRCTVGTMGNQSFKLHRNLQGDLNMWNIPSKKRLQQIPKLYATEDIALKDKLIYLHFFIGGSGWYIAEYDGQDTFWGYVILNGDDQNAEWGYISFRDLKGIKIGYVEIDCELERLWKIKPASQIDNIKT